MISLLLLNNFYPAMSYRRVQKKRKATNYCIRSLVMVREPVASASSTSDNRNFLIHHRVVLSPRKFQFPETETCLPSFWKKEKDSREISRHFPYNLQISPGNRDRRIGHSHRADGGEKKSKLNGWNCKLPRPSPGVFRASRFDSQGIAAPRERRKNGRRKK